VREHGAEKLTEIAIYFTLTWSTASNGKLLIYLDFGKELNWTPRVPWKVDHKSISGRRPQISSSDGHKQWCGTVPHEQEPCVPPTMVISCH